ncbi:MAG: oligosaccharide flippase family protein, partial [Candidatus Nezhaarchaeota archaeon]|nr:oligosaccharide flippase family protein [Candidatus Nezhaarchaeota archaeon]
MSVGRRAASGGFLLSTGSAVATLLSAAGGVVVARLLTPSEYGIIGIALILPLTVSSLADLGFSSALVRFSSMGRGPEDYVATGLLFKLLTAILSGLLVFTLADQFSLILGRPYVAPMLKILSVYACSYTFIGAMAQILVGLGEYWKVTLVNCVQNLLRVTISIALILTGLGVYGAIWGFSVSYTVSAAIALLLLIKRVRTSCFSRFNRGAFREMLSYSLPLYVPVLLGVPVGQYFNMLLAWFTTDEEIGNYRIAANLLTPLSIIGGGISTALFSSFPLLVNEEYKLRDAVRKAAIYTSMIIVPLSLALIVFSEPATLLIYGDAYRLSPIYLSILALQGLLVPLGSAVIGPYLNSIGATRKTMKISLFNMLIGIPLATILVMDHGILGLIASSL